jgi:hypothetical protein
MLRHPILAIAGIGVASILGRAWRMHQALVRVRAKHHARIIAQIALLLDVTVADLSPLIGATPRMLEGWARGAGVPRPWQQEVAELRRATLGLRRLLSARQARHLLQLRQRRGAQVAARQSLLAQIAQRVRPRRSFVVITR